jgi:magnesium-transporting ATPase (P-type)
MNWFIYARIVKNTSTYITRDQSYSHKCFYKQLAFSICMWRYACYCIGWIFRHLHVCFFQPLYMSILFAPNFLSRGTGRVRYSSSKNFYRYIFLSFSLISIRSFHHFITEFHSSSPNIWMSVFFYYTCNASFSSTLSTNLSVFHPSPVRASFSWSLRRFHHGFIFSIRSSVCLFRKIFLSFLLLVCYLFTLHAIHYPRIFCHSCKTICTGIILV